jgi:hypothetical protein
VALAVAFEALSCVSYVLMFRPILNSPDRPELCVVPAAT